MSKRTRVLYVVVAAATTLAVLSPPNLAPVGADPGSTTITLQGKFDQGMLTLTGDMSIGSLTLDAPLEDGCGMPIGADGQLCIGKAMGTDEPLEIRGAAYPLVKSDRAFPALQWIVDEAVQAIRQYYDVPLDYRIERYAAAEVRAYIQNRVVDIMDKAAYGKTLTAQERTTLEFVEQQVIELDKKITAYAHEEYLEWYRKGCSYSRPAAPAWVTNPVEHPIEEIRWCSRAHSAYETLFLIAPPSPSVGHFLAWGMYRNASELGLDSLSEVASQNQLLQSVAAGVVLGGIATAIAAAGGTAAIVGSSAALSAAAAGAMGSFAATSTALGVLGPGGVAAAFASVGPAAAATVVAIVILAIVVTSISIAMVVERQEIGNTLYAKMQAAGKVKDPFGLIPLAATQSGLELREGITPSTLPYYRSAESLSRILQFVSQWTSVDDSGTFRPDAAGLWNENATTTDDYRFQVRIDGGPAQDVDSITVPTGEGETATVRFSRSWMVVTPEGGQPTAALSFGYINESGNVAYANRLHDDGGVAWVITRERGADKALGGARAAVIQYRDDSGHLVEVRIIAPTVQVLGGPRPTAVGPLTLARYVILRPNPVSDTGEYLLDRFATDYSYEWKVTRFDTTAQDWIPVSTETPAGYGTRFIPEETGQYRAIVTMRDLDGIEPDVSGIVEFPVVRPEITFDQLELEDDGTEELTLNLQLSEQIPDDDFEVTVRWPGAFGDDAVVETFSVDCAEGATDCQSMPIAHQHTLDRYADVSQGVTVTVRNGYGSSTMRELEIAGAKRLTFAAPVNPPLPEQLGTVEYSGNSASVQVPIQVDGPSEYDVAMVVPVGDDDIQGFGLYDPATDTAPSILFPFGSDSHFWVSLSTDPSGGAPAIIVHGAPELEELGIHEIPVIVQQNSPSALVRTPFLIRLQVVAAPGDRYRGVLLSDRSWTSWSTDILPAFEAQILGGRAEWGDASERLCMSIVYVPNPVDPRQMCGGYSDFFDATGRPYPFPYQTLLPEGVRQGTHRATVWLPDVGDHVTSKPFSITFSLVSGPPRIENLAWNKAAGRVELSAQPAQDTTLESVVCTLDGVTTPCFEESFSTWSPGALAEGAHELVVMPTVDSGNYTTGALNFVIEGDGESVGPGSDDTDPVSSKHAEHETSGPSDLANAGGDRGSAGSDGLDTTQASETPAPEETTPGGDRPAPSADEPGASASGEDQVTAVAWIGGILGTVILLLAAGGLILARRRAH